LGVKEVSQKLYLAHQGQYDTVVSLGPTTFDVVNINQFYAIIGMGFMCKFGIMLEPEHDSILISRVPAPTLSEGEETAELAHRHSLRHAQPVSH